MCEIEIQQIHPLDAKGLISELDDYQQRLYPPESNHLESVDDLSQPNVMMYGCFVDGELAAIGALKLMPGYGEVKRVYVPPKNRGKGLAKRIMDRIEGELADKGLDLIRLETGIHQKEAIGLYEKMGYAVRSPFGDYGEDPLSLFMEKRIE